MMRIRVLGCSGAIAQGCHTTAFLVGERVLIDAGTGVGELTPEDMARIDDVFLSHSHLDHIAALPLMLDTVAKLRRQPLRVHALEATLETLRRHVFNDLIWPDFTRLPSVDSPFVTLHPLACGEVVACADCRVEALPARHTVPALGYAVDAGRGAWVFSGDTGGTPDFWARVRQLPLRALVIETAFGEAERALALRSGHLSPSLLMDELRQLGPAPDVAVHITHTKPTETADIVEQLQALWGGVEHPPGRRPRFQWLASGDEFEV